MKNNRRRRGTGPIYTFAASWALLSVLFPVFRAWGLALILALSSFAAYLAGLISGKKHSEDESSEEVVKAAAEKVEAQKKTAAVKKSYGPDVDPIIEEGNKALSEMGRLYMSIKDTEVRSKINEIMRVTDKIMQDAISDPSDIPQIKKFMSYYLPTTIKLLNAYDRMGAQGIEGENLDKSMKSINEMLDSAIEAYKKLFDSLFADQALDIETDIQVMNTMLAREGLSGEKDFNIK